MSGESNKKPALVPKLRFPEFRGAEAWKKQTLSFACQMQAGKFVSASEIKERNALGLYPCYGGNGLRGYTATFTHSGKYSLIGRQGALCGNVKIGVGQFHATEHAVVVTPKNGIKGDWLFYLLDLLNLNQFATGQAQPGLSVDVLEKLPIAIPNQESEQQKIAECLSSVDELIAAQARKMDALKTHKKGLMQQLFPREGETQPRLRFPEFQDSGEWGEHRLDELGHYENGKAHENDISENGRYIVVNSKFISTEGAIRKFSNEGFCVADKGDVLMVLSDVPNGRAIAKCYFVESDDLYTVNQRICRIQPIKINGQFLFYVLDRNSYFLDFDDGIKQTNLRKEDVVGFPLCTPPQPAEQQRIADCLTSLDDLITAQTQKLEGLKTHKQGLMQQLFPSPAEVEV